MGGSIIESGGYYANTSQYNNPTYQIYSPTQRTITPSLAVQQLVSPNPAGTCYMPVTFSSGCSAHISPVNLIVELQCTVLP